MIKRLAHAACAAALAAAMAMPAFAADLPPPTYKARPGFTPYYVAPFSWSGFYVGINGGYGFGKSNWTVTGLPISTGDFDLNGGVAGGTLGYNMQTGVWVWGIEGDFDYSWIKGTDTTTCGAPGCETQNTWLATGRLRVGYAWDRWLPYITGGAAGGNIKLGGAGLANESKTKIGWTAGLGVEYAFLGAWSAKLEYLYVDLGSAQCDAATCGGATVDGTFKTNLVRAGINYRF